MNGQCVDISDSIGVLNDNLIKIAQVEEWADLMGYQSTKKFSRTFLRYYSVRPCKILVAVRLESMYRQLQAGTHSNFQIARRHCLPDEIALNKFVNYHLGCSPRKLKSMTAEEFEAHLEKFGSKIR